MVSRLWIKLTAAILLTALNGSTQDAKSNAGTYGSDTYESGGAALTPLERRGRDTWYFWTGGDQRLWRKLAIVTNGVTDLLLYVDSRRNGHRFRDLGVITQPGCRAAAQADEFGLWFDDCQSENLADIPGQATGILGLRKFPNPEFDKAKWSIEKYRQNPKEIEPPYLIGMACGFCHNALSPLNPPDDPEHPEWRNIVSAFGNQYFEEGKFFSLNLKPDDFRWHVGNRQPPGTSDTSRVATDHIFNPNAINSIFSLGDRPFHPEKMSDGSVREVHHILKDGADSIGVAGASLRVYVNIGMCSEYWLSLHDPVEGKGTQKPFLIEKARADCADWRATEERMPAAEAFLKTLTPMYLKDAPGGGYYLTKDPEVLRRGKIVFGEQCASCHSSKRPPSQIAAGSPEALEWYRQSALADDFLTGNFLSDDERHSVAEIGTNISRAAASNAVRGHVWDNFSSETYKDLPGPGVLRDLYNPIKPSDPISFNMEAGGRGYYRTPTLIGAWATAPFFHNNALGVFLKNPSVAGRVAAFEDAMEKLLWPEKRLGVQSILVTTAKSTITRGDGSELEIPSGMPVKLVASVDPNRLLQLGPGGNWFTRLLGKLFGGKILWDQLLRNNLAPDFIEDRGHTFGSDLPDPDKHALIEFVKTF
jgi:mono/diheme cytochrome c family protein